MPALDLIRVARTFRTRPAPPPRFDLLPVPLQSSLRLSGAAVPCGPGLRGVGWPETPTVRAAALAPWLANGRIAVQMTAAWVWGAARTPGAEIVVSVPQGHRSSLVRDPGCRVLHLRLHADDVVHLHGLAVSSPQRTVLDLLYAEEELTVRRRVACRLLAQIVPGGWATIRGGVEGRRRPGRRRALERLAGVDPLRAGQEPVAR